MWIESFIGIKLGTARVIQSHPAADRLFKLPASLCVWSVSGRLPDTSTLTCCQSVNKTTWWEKHRVVRSYRFTVLLQTLEHPHLWFPRRSPACGLECLHWNCLWNELKYVCISCFSFRERIRGKRLQTHKCVCGLSRAGALLNLSGPRHGTCYLFLILAALCGFPAVTALRVETGTNEQLHPACLAGIMGLWSDQASGCTLILVVLSLLFLIFTCSSIIFPYFIFPLDNDSFFLFNFLLLLILISFIAPPQAFSPMTLWLAISHC